jgi:hypothetical protein
MMTTTVRDRQSLFDIAVSTAGSIEAVSDIAGVKGIGITGELRAGMELTVPEVLNKEVADYFRTNGIIPATAVEEGTDQGIDFWAIEHNFIIN